MAAPSVVSIVRVNSTPTNATTSLSYTVTFSEDVDFVDPSDFAVTPTGTASANIFSVVIANPAVYTVTLGAISGDGTLRLDLNATGTGIQAFATGLDVTGGFTSGQIYTVDHSAPIAASVSSSTANGTYKIGDTISVNVNFGEAVTVTGTPQVTLETGTTDRTINYASGSGTSTLTFNYTVQAGDTTADLDYISTSALALNGGTIKDSAGNDAFLALPSPGAANSLGANKNIVVDGVAPTVSAVTSSTANGAYKAGDVISVNVNLSEAVTVTGTPQLTLETGTTDQTINYTSGSGTSTLTFNYTVQAGDTTADLDYLSTGALALNGGTIKDAAGNDASLMLAAPGAANSLGANKNVVVDTSAPSVSAVTSSTANASYKVGDVVSVNVNFNEAVTVSGTPQITLETGLTDRVVNYASGSGTSSLTFTYTVQAGDTSADLDYIATSALVLNGGTIRDAAGNNATLTLAAPGAANSLGANKAIVIDGVAPTLSSSTPADDAANVSASANLVLTFNEGVQRGTGAIELHASSGGALIESFDAATSNKLVFSGSGLTIDPTADLSGSTGYYLTVQSGAVQDLAGNSYAGISTNTALNFTTLANGGGGGGGTTAVTPIQSQVNSALDASISTTSPLGAVSDRVGASVELYKFFLGATPTAAEIQSRAQLAQDIILKTAAANPSAPPGAFALEAWDELGASFADSKFSSFMSGPVGSVGVSIVGGNVTSADAFLTAAFQTVFGTQPVVGSNYISASTVRFGELLGHFLDSDRVGFASNANYSGNATDPTGVIRAKGAFVAELLKQAEDANIGSTHDFAVSLLGSSPDLLALATGWH